MNSVGQALIIAGGLGTRMSLNMNPLRCKSLIKYKGEFMIGYLLDNLVTGGISRFVIATNTHSHQLICEIVKRKKLKNVLVIVAYGENGGIPDFNEVPYQVKDLLEERFLMVCGHHPVSVQHIKKMVNCAEKHANVFTGYKNKVYKIDKEKRVIYENNSFKYIDLTKEKIGEDYIYVRNPYILQKEIIISVHESRLAETFSYYIFKKWEESTEELGVVMADMPPEFDYDEDYEKTKNFLDS